MRKRVRHWVAVLGVALVLMAPVALAQSEPPSGLT